MLKTLTIPSVEEGWSNWKYHTLLMGIQNDRAILQKYGNIF